MPVALAAYAHYKYVPMVRNGFASMLEGVALPYLTQLALAAGPWLVAIAILMIILGVASVRFSGLQHPILVGFIGSAIAVGLLIYGLSFSLPLITITNMIGEASLPAAAP